MAWENSIDRLVLQQVHQAEKGEVRANLVRQQVLDLQGMSPGRPQAAFHLGYARVLLGLELPEPKGTGNERRWFTYGRLRAHDRRGERNWVAEMIQDQSALIDLLQEPEIAASCLPVVMRSLFSCGDLNLAINAIEYLSTTDHQEETSLLVDAALTDLLGRLEFQVLENSVESTVNLLQRCVRLDAFGYLPTDVRSRYFRALGHQHLQLSEFDIAAKVFDDALELADNQPRLRSSIATLRGLAGLRLHDLTELQVNYERGDRQAGEPWFLESIGDLKHAVPDALFAAGILAYENRDLDTAVLHFDAAVNSSRRSHGRDEGLLDRCRFFVAAALLAAGKKDEINRAVRMMDQALESVAPDLEIFYPVHEELKRHDRRVALKFLDSLDLARGTAPDQMLIVALEYLGLGEAEPAAKAAARVLEVSVNLDQRIEAMRVLLTADNMRGNRDEARKVFDDIRDLLTQRGAFAELESLLLNEEFVGQALDHLEIKCELVALYEEMEDREVEKATLQSAIARSLKARKDVSAMQEAHGILKEVEVSFPELARDEILALEKLLALSQAEPANLEAGARQVQELKQALGRDPRVLVVGGNESQRRHHPRFEKLAADWGLEGEWLMANYTSPQKLVGDIQKRLQSGLDILILLHWNRHETTEPALELARKHNVSARTVHYAGFTSLQVGLQEMLERQAAAAKEKVIPGKGRRK